MREGVGPLVQGGALGAPGRQLGDLSFLLAGALASGLWSADRRLFAVVGKASKRPIKVKAKARHSNKLN